MRRLILLLLLFVSVALFAKREGTLRERIPVFERSTWNALDAMDDTPGYDRSMHVLEQSVFIPSSWREGCVTFVSLGANQEVWLEVNGHEVGYHAGGYTAFSFDISPYVQAGCDNLIKARITNAHNDNIPPLSADFTFFGGFYRDAFLLHTPASHITTTFFGTDGVTVETPRVTPDLADVRVTTRLSGIQSPAYVCLRLNGKQVAREFVPPHTTEIAQSFSVEKPALWSPDSPALYSLEVCLTDRRGKLLDRVCEPIGFRFYSFDEKGMFCLNGKRLRLIGTNRHQCYDRVGWATPDSIHRKDMFALKAMGGNFLRVSHYPQDPLIMHLCDSLGILCSVEIPIVNTISESEAFSANCLHMAEEMVWQNRNHPSVIMWGYMNEILLAPPFKYTPGQEERHRLYLKNLNRLAASLNDRFHALDSERYTFAAFHDALPDYHECGLDTLADVIGHNLYSGWYRGTIESVDDKVRELYEGMHGRPQLMSEYGADCDVRLRSDHPLKFDYTIDYAVLFHRHYLNLLLTTDLMAGGTAWNLNDFHSEVRAGAIPHLNLKGLITLDRTPKATYYLYQSILLPEEADRKAAEQKMKELLRMPVPQEWPLCILLGSNRYYTDTEGLVWQPDRPYAPGSWGYLGGVPYRRKTGFGDLPECDVVIYGTQDLAIYQTARMAIPEFRLDVPDGDYRLTLYFAELETPGEQKLSPYNLGNTIMDTGFTGRCQTILVNGREVITDQHLDTYRATQVSFPVTCHGGEGIRICLSASEGATILNAIRLDR